MSIKTHHYNNEEITVNWKPDICIHSAICFRSLPAVFKPRDRPWVQLSEAADQDIRDTVNACPSGALSLRHTMLEEIKVEAQTESWNKVHVLKNGPLRIKEACHITMADGSVVEKPFGVSLCRCGASANKPFCDGTHKINGFTD